jgi:hypothetical protein
LARAFGFTEEALGENRRGRLHPSQVPRLKKKRRGIYFETTKFVIFAPLLLFIGGLGLGNLLGISYDLLLGHQPTMDAIVIWGLLPLVTCITFMLVIFYFFEKARMNANQYTKDMTLCRVMKIEGLIALKKELIITGRGLAALTRIGARIDYFAAVATDKFSVRRQEFKALENGRHYRFYYTPRARVVVAAEVIEP